MTITRRDTLKAGLALSAAAALPAPPTRAHGGFAPRPDRWRTFELLTHLDIAEPAGAVQAWIPLPSISDAAWSRLKGTTWTTNAEKAVIAVDPGSGATMLHLAWPQGGAQPTASVKSTVAARSRAADFGKPSGRSTTLSAEERAAALAATRLIPTDGIVKETSDGITAGAASDLEKARRIYDWIVETTYRDPGVRGCGLGDVVRLLESGRPGGKCADLNGLFVGLARAAGIPARDLYGLRVAPSEFGYVSLGTKGETATRAQHCRAEIFLEGFGWVAADPADVRKVVLEELPGNLALTDDKVTQAREALFGSWERNWLPYNSARDVALPGSEGPKLGFLMYPQAEIGGHRLDCLEADAFRYAITAREIAI